MQVKTSARVAQVKPSATMAVSSKAAELKAAGHDIISLGAGEPDFDTPEHIKQAAIDAIKAGQTKYTAVPGTPALLQAIIGKFERENKLHYSANEIIASTGAKQCIYNLLQALINVGDEVLIPAPYWVSYPDMVRLADGEPVIMNTTWEDNFKISPKQLENSMTGATRLLIMNSPSNPSGGAYSRKELQAIGDVLSQNPRIVIVTDDIYEHIYWGDEPFSTLLNVCPELKDRTVVVNGVSKAYAMTGWRLGYAAGPAELIKEMRKVQSQSTSNPCSITQAAAVAALSGPQDSISTMRGAFKRRHDYFIEALNKLPGVKCLPCAGAFYALASFQTVIDRMEDIGDDVELAAWLLEHAGVSMVPGTPFGVPGYLRASYATSMENLQEAIARLASKLPA
jgi:aspartate aminotransferase